MQHLFQVFQLQQQVLSQANATTNVQVTFGGAVTFLPYRWCRLACDEMNNFPFVRKLQFAEHEWEGFVSKFPLSPGSALHPDKNR